ncbi:hypothetical protein VNI00_015870 [Paramarasmius palmivorus]|uniref:DUF6532 domain-containing protein n=1 Tax=Paramarasmius palmivorus TaxID=297713 RepID=A0AAW0BHR8_9AGAR
MTGPPKFVKPPSSRQRSTTAKKQAAEKHDRFVQDYYEEHGKEPPESEDDDFSEDNQKERGGYTSDPEERIFPSSLRALNTITNSPTRKTIRKTSHNQRTSPIPSRLQLQTPSSTPMQSAPAPQWSSQQCSSQSQATTMPPADNPSSSTAPPTDNPSPLTAAPTDKTDNEPNTQPLKFSAGTSGQKLHDYEGISKILVRRALFDYEAHILGVEMFPNPDDQSRSIHKIWSCRCAATISAEDPPFKLTSEIFKLMSRRATRVRSAARTRLEPLIVPMFGFDIDVTSSQVISKNIQTYTLLTTDFGWYYEDPAGRKGYLRHPIILNAIHRVLFYNSTTAYGSHNDYFWFDPISLEALACIFSLIDHCLSQWSTGAYIRTDLDEQQMVYTYAKHVNRLQEWAELDDARTTRFRRKLTDQARSLAGVLTPPQDLHNAMSQQDREEALRELQDDDSDGSGSDSEHEDTKNNKKGTPANEACEPSNSPAEDTRSTKDGTSDAEMSGDESANERYGEDKDGARENEGYGEDVDGGTIGLDQPTSVKAGQKRKGNEGQSQQPIKKRK